VSSDSQRSRLQRRKVPWMMSMDTFKANVSVMGTAIAVLSAALLACLCQTTAGFQIPAVTNVPGSKLFQSGNGHLDDEGNRGSDFDRRDFIGSVASYCALATGLNWLQLPANAAVGTLPEFSDTNAIVQGVTINVADRSQQDDMIKFLENGFDFKVLRKRIVDSVEDTWLGYGPEQLSIPDDFELPVSSFANYGGHASIHIRYDSRITTPLYRQGDNPPGDNIAFLQVGVPGYRISQMVAAGGNILDAYGLVNVVSPAGLPMRGIVGISPDPIMFIAINCENVKESAAFYEKLGFVEQAYPFSRPSKGTTIFEPDKPKNAIYMAPSPNCMGVLLLQNKGRKKVTPNPAVGPLNIVYTPAADASDGESELMLKDPSGLPIQFQSVDSFSKLEKITR